MTPSMMMTMTIIMRKMIAITETKKTMEKKGCIKKNTKVPDDSDNADDARWII
jgi:hypothetical protein